jgi:S-adenosylmethionine hydrolase
VITFCSDFGTADPYAAMVKGVMLSIHSKAKIIDLSHDLSAHDIRRAAFFIASACPVFPAGTIHLCVVDPGVGSSRKPVLLATEKGIYIGPDNGVFSLIWQSSRRKSVYWLCHEKYFFKDTSRTFDARDLFGPVAAYLSLGVAPKEFGPRLASISKFSLPAVSKRPAAGRKRRRFLGEIVYIDRFGNLITNFPYRLLEGRRQVEVKIGGVKMRGLASNYAMIPEGGVAPILGSLGFLEIAAHAASAQRLLKSHVGSKVELIAQ